jgi:acyl-[acyl-carrier-protein]-phospholipid O-acyltransferase/long-chain-fatty-acid--[acyl-carrier-protein] ligase
VANPLDGKLVGQTVRQEKATLLFGTPTFLLNYLRRCEKEDFATLRYVVAGAEKLKVQLIDAFEKKFCIRPHEGYGATELSPLAALNVADADFDDVFQVGTKEGTVGHNIPGLALRVVHPETGEPMGFDEPVYCGSKAPMS